MLLAHLLGSQSLSIDHMLEMVVLCLANSTTTTTMFMFMFDWDMKTNLYLLPNNKANQTEMRLRIAQTKDLCEPQEWLDLANEEDQQLLVLIVSVFTIQWSVIEFTNFLVKLFSSILIVSFHQIVGNIEITISMSQSSEHESNAFTNCF